MMTFFGAQTIVSTARDKRSKPIENNTRVEKVDEDTFGVKLHDTYVVLIHRDGTYTLNTGGWHTVTTKARINGYGPARVGSDRGKWFLFDRTWTKTAVFFDGMRITASGAVLNPRPIAVEVAAQHAAAAARARIKGYVELYIAAGREQIYVDAMDAQPEGAMSCWDCANPTMAGRTTEDGDATAHLVRHIRPGQEEFPPELLHTAMKAKGAGPYYFQLIGGASYMVDLSRMDRGLLDNLRKWLRDYLTTQLVEDRRKPFVDYSARRAS